MALSKYCLYFLRSALELFAIGWKNDASHDLDVSAHIILRCHSADDSSLIPWIPLGSVRWESLMLVKRTGTCQHVRNASEEEKTGLDSQCEEVCSREGRADFPSWTQHPHRWIRVWPPALTPALDALSLFHVLAFLQSCTYLWKCPPPSSCLHHSYFCLVSYGFVGHAENVRCFRANHLSTEC